MSGISHTILALTDSVLAALFQPICLHCGVYCEAEQLCGFCRRFDWLEWGCEVCGAKGTQKISACGACLKRRPSFTRARSLLALNAPMLSVLHQAKYAQWAELLEIFRPLIHERFEPFFPPCVAVPVPLHRKRYLERGFNQSEVLAKMLLLPVNSTSLKKTRATPPQSTLSRVERRKNLRGSFEWQGPVPERILIVDDVYTTGATLNEVAGTLKRAGAREVYVWTLFRA